MAAVYRCLEANRRESVLASPDLNGIDYLEVGAGQTTLRVVFLHDLPGTPEGVPSGAPPLGASDFAVVGGVRIRGIRITGVSPDPASDDTLVVTVDRPGDFSTYRLLLLEPGGEGPPAGFDPRLAEVPFSFKVDCPSDFDCERPEDCPPQPLAEPQIDYLAKDYESFRRLMLDRLAVIMPDWKERNPSDLQVALVEMLAYAGDQLSYYQDAVATEAYLGTARLRGSIRRHARLLDYHVHQGCNARAWVTIEVSGTVPLDPGTPILTRGSDPSVTVDPTLPPPVLADGPVVFETMHSVTLRPSRNRIAFHTWSDEQCCLPRGATSATLVNEPPLALAVGDVVVLEEVRSPTTGQEAEADPSHRQAVRLTHVEETRDEVEGVDVVNVAWHARDALGFPLCLTAAVSGEGGTEVVQCSVARGNVVLADHGRTVGRETPEPLIPDRAPVERPYLPGLREGPVTFAEPLDPDRPAAAMTGSRDPHRALPEIRVVSRSNGDRSPWGPRRDLLASDRFDPGFVAEVTEEGAARLRFGDGVNGRRPSPGATFAGTYRVGGGRAGNVGAGALARVGFAGSGIDRVSNPLPATGGTEPEAAELVREVAPDAFRVQERAVTEADWAEVTERHPEIQRAAATFRWTGSWYTVFVTVDRRGGLDVDAAFRQRLARFLDRYRLAGHDLEVDAPVPVPLDIALFVCADADAFRGHVLEALLEAFGRRDVGGWRGFFHPDRFTFGQPLYLSQVYGTALSVPGVASVRALRFQRWGKAPNDELEQGVLTPGRLEVVRLDNDPNFPENGRIEFQIEGGL
ncbi:MAG TPA: putative baseplate assembly protein [Actinomycetota bacterium]|nr:putative baseplate assembly protein [Actinomycetota bacterium]